MNDYLLRELLDSMDRHEKDADEKLIEANTKLVDKNRYLEADKELLKSDINKLIEFITLNKIIMTEEVKEVVDRYTR